MQIDSTLLFMTLAKLPIQKQKQIIKDIIMPQLKAIKEILNEKDTKKTK